MFTPGAVEKWLSGYRVYCPYSLVPSTHVRVDHNLLKSCSRGIRYLWPAGHLQESTYVPPPRHIIGNKVNLKNKWSILQTIKNAVQHPLPKNLVPPSLTSLLRPLRSIAVRCLSVICSLGMLLGTKRTFIGKGTKGKRCRELWLGGYPKADCMLAML